MSATYHHLVEDLSRRYGVSVEQIEHRVQSRRARTRGMLGPLLAARTVAASLALGAMETRLGQHIAAGASHVTGLKEADAIAAAHAEQAGGRLSTLGYWARPGEAPSSIAEHYLRAIDALAEAGLTSSVSIKADQLGFDRALVLGVVRAAQQRALRVHFDAQGHETLDRTHALVGEALMLGADVSATLPSRFQRSLVDAERFIGWRIPVRVVKGQGGDPEHPKIDPRRSFLELVDCLAGRARHVGVATHDRRVAEPALDRLLAAGTPCALEQMRSLPRLDFIASRRLVPVRAYIAYGHAGLPYAIGELMRRPAILGWIVRDLVVRHAPSSTPESSSQP